MCRSFPKLNAPKPINQKPPNQSSLDKPFTPFAHFGHKPTRCWTAKGWRSHGLKQPQNRSFGDRIGLFIQLPQKAANLNQKIQAAEIPATAAAFSGQAITPYPAAF